MAPRATLDERKRRGAWFTPPRLVDVLVDGLLDGFEAPEGQPVRVLDPACGDGRLLSAIGERLRSAGTQVALTGCDVDAATLASIDDPGIRLLHTDALAHDWADERFDVVIGNPPFLSQMSAATTRGGASRHGGGPYADAAAEFLGLAVRLARPDGGRIGLVLPQSVLGARDAAPIRRAVDTMAHRSWSWWERDQDHFDANVNVCVVGLERPARGGTAPWTSIVTDRLGVPRLDPDDLAVDGTLGDRADLNSNFRDEYYALVPAVSDEADGPPLVTSGLIDPGRCRWGERPVRFAKRRFDAPRVDLERLDGRFPAWAERKLVPKVLIANQTRIVEAVADPSGAWLPGVPVTTATPTGSATVHQIAAVLTSPVASVLAWSVAAGTGLSTTSIRLSPATLAATPWPAGDLSGATAALARGDLDSCAKAVCVAYDLAGPGRRELLSWWTALRPDDADAPG